MTIPAQTHTVLNQSVPTAGRNAYTLDTVRGLCLCVGQQLQREAAFCLTNGVSVLGWQALVESVAKFGGAKLGHDHLTQFGERVGSAEVEQWCEQVCVSRHAKLLCRLLLALLMCVLLCVCRPTTRPQSSRRTTSLAMSSPKSTFTPPTISCSALAWKAWYV